MVSCSASRNRLASDLRSTRCYEKFIELLSSLPERFGVRLSFLYVFGSVLISLAGMVVVRKITRNKIALTLFEQALADQVVPTPVLGDAAYGNGFAFRPQLRELNLEFFLQVTPEEHKAWIQRGAHDPP
jgi:hypothetical protein